MEGAGVFCAAARRADRNLFALKEVKRNLYPKIVWERRQKGKII